MSSIVNKFKLELELELGQTCVDLFDQLLR
jgi:hypothetical protein